MQDEDFSELLKDAQDGNQGAKDQLFELIDHDLRNTAARIVRQRGPFAQATSLVNEAYLRLFREAKKLDLKNRQYFFAAMIDKMHKVLSDRIRKEARRPASSPLEALGDIVLEQIEEVAPFSYVEMRDALNRLKKSRNARKARRHKLLEYHYIAGMTIKEAAENLGISYTLARDEKRLAQAELYQDIKSRQE